VQSAADWKRYYAAERERMGVRALRELVDAATPLPVAPGDAIVVPHTRLEVTGPQIGRAVATAVASGAERVLAIGVLHGRRRDDQSVRGVHREDGLAADEFSLDAFVELMSLAAREVEVIRRYPLLVGDRPASLPGIDELGMLAAAGALVVATTDPIHHGHAYGAPPDACLDANDPATLAAATAMIDAQLAALSDHRFDDFATLCDDHRSDFRDTGPVLAHLLGAGIGWRVHDVALVDYSAALAAPSPSWVAGALATAASS
jgi:hypothetical protein